MEREVPKVFELDSTFLDHWNDVVKNRAEKILDVFVNGSNILFPLRPLKKGQIPVSMEAKEICQDRKKRGKS